MKSVNHRFHPTYPSSADSFHRNLATVQISGNKPGRAINLAFGLYSPPRQSPLVSHSESISGYSHQSVDSIPSDTHGQCVFSSNEGNSEFPGTLCTTAVGNRRPGPRDFFQPLQGSFGHLLSCLALFGTALEHTGIRVADIRAAN